MKKLQNTLLGTITTGFLIGITTMMIALAAHPVKILFVAILTATTLAYTQSQFNQLKERIETLRDDEL